MAYLDYECHPCCGVELICNIGDSGLIEIRELFGEEVKKRIRAGRRALFEITLTDGQMKDNKSLLKEMKRLKFKRVSRFFNSNSGNNVNVFHKTSKPQGRAPKY